MKLSRKVILMLFIAIFITSTFAMTRSVHAAIINVVPGPNAIQNAVTAASPGDTINVAAGIYPEAITINKQLSLIGAPGAIIQPVAGNPLQDGGVRRAGIYITANGVTVQGFEIDGTKTMVNYGIYGLSASNLVLTGNVIHDMTNSIALGDNSGVGILIFGWGVTCSNNVISSNVVYNTGRMGISICAMQSSSPYNYLIESGNTISWNVAYNTWQGPTNDGGGGIQVNGAKNTLIFDNQVHDTQTAGSSWLKSGIYIYGSDIGNSITCNDVYNNKYGIVTWIDAGGGVVGLTATTPAIENNNIYQNTALGVYNVAAPTLDATNNWWDSKNGPGSVGPGSGDHVGANVDYSSYSNSPASCAPHFTLTVTSAQDSPTTTTSNIVIGANVAPAGWIVTASVTSPVILGLAKYTSLGWTGTGDVPASGSGTTTPAFTITQNSMITWLWKTQWSVTFAQTGLSSDASGTVLTVGVTTYTYNTFPSSAMYLDDGTTYSYTGTVPAGTGKQYVLTGVTGPTSPIHSGGTVTGNYKTQYYLTVTSLYDSPTGAGWHDSGSTVTSSVTSPTGNARSTGWTGTGDVPASGIATTVTFTITQASAITWNWALGPVKAPSVGGQWTPITMQALSPLNTLGLMAPWIALALIAAATAVATYRRLLKKHSIPTSA